MFVIKLWRHTDEAISFDFGMVTPFGEIATGHRLLLLNRTALTVAPRNDE